MRTCKRVMQKSTGIIMQVMVSVFGTYVLTTSIGVERRSDQFVAVSSDETAIYAQIDFPVSDVRAAVFLIPGSGGFNRDMRFGNSGTSRDLIFKDLSNELTEAGFAVIRYDERGYDCSAGSPCPDERAIARTTPETKSHDLQTVAETALARMKLNSRCMLVIAHSEGVLNVARATQGKRFRPAGIVAVGGFFRSPVTAMKWQLSGRMQRVISNMDANRDGSIDQGELDKGWKQATWSSMPPPQHLLLKSQGLTRDAVERALGEINGSYDRIRLVALSQDDRQPFKIGGRAKASNRWWKQWFTDDTPVLERLLDYDGRLVALFGDTDAQIDVDAEVAELKKMPARAASIIRLPGKGHALGPDPVLGPMHADAKRAIIDALRALSQC